MGYPSVCSVSILAKGSSCSTFSLVLSVCMTFAVLEGMFPNNAETFFVTNNTENLFICIFSFVHEYSFCERLAQDFAHYKQKEG